MFLIDIFNQVFTLLQSLFINIPLNNSLAVIYVAINFVIQLLATFLGGEVDLPSSGGF